jgi:hypothetical protein
VAGGAAAFGFGALLVLGLGLEVVERLEELQALVGGIRNALRPQMQRIRRQRGDARGVGNAHGETLHVRFFSE